jgi:predicted type IV restriction endonuclease
MTAPPEVIDLVDRFATHRDAYRSGRYNETQLRREFLDPLFTALGWDVDNEQGYAEAYKDVVHEDAVKVGGLTKAPDYAFRVGGVRKFFIEAKAHIPKDQESGIVIAPGTPAHVPEG